MTKTTSFFFYDLETSGVNPREARIMQFAGQRTDMDLQPIGEPINVLIKLTDDILPDPDAILITGITPQQTIADGMTEAEFLRLFYDEVALAGTIFVGYNSVRFDDEFMRYLHYRNFYDAYEWQYTDGKSRWDLLDVVRMTRALRPDDIQWPVDASGKPTNRLELLTKANGISHDGAHDALSDVNAVIDLARLIRGKQQKLFDYLLKMRDKKAVMQLVQTGDPFVYSSGKYDSAFEKTTVAAKLADHPKRQGALVYDLRHDPGQFTTLSVPQLVEAWTRKWDDPGLRLPIKTLQYNRCPAVAPLGVLDAASQQRLQIDMQTITQHAAALKTADLAPKILQALEIMDSQQLERQSSGTPDVDARLYDGFLADADKNNLKTVRQADAAELGTMTPQFTDKRLPELFERYKARNFPTILDDQERTDWEAYRHEKLLGGGQNSRMARFFARLGQLDGQTSTTPDQRFLLEELQLYGQSIMPLTDED